MPKSEDQDWPDDPQTPRRRTKTKHGGKAEAPFTPSKGNFAPESVGIVIENQHKKVQVLYESKVQIANLTGDSLRNSHTLVPGDKLVVKADSNGLTTAQVVPRHSALMRMKRDYTRHSGKPKNQVIAANIDKVVIVASAGSPPFHPRLIDRYLVLVQSSNVEPVICLNKADLASTSERKQLARFGDSGIAIVETSAATGVGIDNLKTLLLSKMVALVGHSGVGKTSLVNALDTKAAYRTGRVGAKSGRGTHTTTSSVLHEWHKDSYIIDTPGIRSLEIWNIEPRELQNYFPEFAIFANKCKYGDCLHNKESTEDCAVKQHVGQPNHVTAERYKSYIRLLNDIKT